jgi:putative hydrolase of the HAD superfamily
LFSPQVIVKIQKPITATVQLFQECIAQNPNQVYILSNWDRESARLIERRFPEIFNLLPSSQIFFSADLGYVKPEPAIYQTVASRLQIDPQACILIDDHIENIRAARACGWQAIQYQTTRQVRQELGRIYAKGNLRTS